MLRGFGGPLPSVHRLSTIHRLCTGFDRSGLILPAPTIGERTYR
jgi:hypothetical protein